jgi:hypothetical protein
MSFDRSALIALKQSLRGRAPYGKVDSVARQTIRRVRKIAEQVFPEGFDVPEIVPISSSARESFYRMVNGRQVIVHDLSYTSFLASMLTNNFDPQPPIESFTLFNLWMAETFLARNQRVVALEISEVSHAKRYHYYRKRDKLPIDAPFYNPHLGGGLWSRVFHPDIFSAPFDAFVLGHEIGHWAQERRLPVLGIDLPYEEIETALRRLSSGYDWDILYPIRPKENQYPSISLLTDGDDRSQRRLFNANEIYSDFAGFVIAAKESMARDVSLEEFCNHFQQVFYFFQILSTLTTFVQNICLTLGSESEVPTARIHYPIYGLRLLGICQAISITLQRHHQQLKAYLGSDLGALEMFRKKPHEMKESWGRIMALWQYARWSFKGTFDVRVLDDGIKHILLQRPFCEYVLEDDWLMLHFSEKPDDAYPDMLLVGFVHALRYTRWVAANLGRAKEKGLGCYRRAAENMTDKEVLELIRRPMNDGFSECFYPF